MLTNPPEITSHAQWLAARKALLEEEKAITRARDRVNAARRRLPMVPVEKDYRFTGPDGEVGLLDLFDGREQLIVHHYMWAFDIDVDGEERPRETGCTSCSSSADEISGLRALHARNTSLVAVTRAPYATLAVFGARMGWTFPWYSSAGSDFNWDFHVTLDERVAPVQLFLRDEAELAAAGTPWTERMRGDYPGLSMFLRVGDQAFHTYSTYGRGLEEFHNGNRYLDLTPLGRQEEWEEPTGRARALGKQVAGPQLRFPDEEDDGRSPA